VTHYNQQGHAVESDCVQFVRLVPNPLVMSDGDPTALPHHAEPVLIGRIGREMVLMFLNLQSRLLEDRRKLLAEVAVREVDDTQAARS
jgi:hypothetical protein